MAVVTWYHPIDKAEQQLKKDLDVVAQRYIRLKQHMLTDKKIKGIRNAKMQRIRGFLGIINANLGNVTDEELLQYLSSGMTQGAQQAIDQINSLLENLAAGAHVLSDKASLKSRLKDLKDFFANLRSLQSLLEQGKKNKMVSYDYDTLVLELNKIAWSFLKSPNLVMNETGNALGHIGAQGAVPYIVQNSIQSIIQSLVPKGQVFGSKVQIVDTGKKRTSGSKKTVTTDTLLIAIDPVKGQATLTISDKFNAKYKKTSTDTGTPIKLATRNVRTFTQDTKASARKGGIATAYKNAIINFLSYHTDQLPLTEANHKRVDFTRRYSNEWKSLREAIGAEMMFHEINRGKGSFDYNGQKINDLIDISFYGGKLYLASDILNTITTRKRNQNKFNLAQISVPQARAKFMTNNKASNARPQNFVIEAYRKGLGETNNYEAGKKKGEEVVGLVLETVTITYSQTIMFS